MGGGREGPVTVSRGGGRVLFYVNVPREKSPLPTLKRGEVQVLMKKNCKGNHPFRTDRIGGTYEGERKETENM